MLISEKINEAASYLAKKIEKAPSFAIVLGSGLGALADQVRDPQIIPYEEIPYWPRSTTPGHAGKLIFGTLESVKVAIMQGRVHYYEGYMMEEVTFPVRVLGKLGVQSLILTNASGGINPDIPPGTIVAIKDHINYMGTNPLIGENMDDLGPRFPDMTMAYDREYLSKIESAALEIGVKMITGVYIAFTGPSFETPAEIKMSRLLGADVVGMSTVPEVIVAGHMGMRVCALSCIANFAAGITDERLTHQEVLENMDRTAGALCSLVSEFLKKV